MDAGVDGALVLGLATTLLEEQCSGHSLWTELLESFLVADALADLEKAIGLVRDFRSYYENGHPGYASCLPLLATCLEHRFNSQKSPNDLEQTISHHQAVLELCSMGHPN